MSSVTVPFDTSSKRVFSWFWPLAASVSMEYRAIVRSKPSWAVLALLCLLELLPANRYSVWDSLDLLFWLQTAWGALGFWVLVVAMMQSQRDRQLGMFEILAPSLLSRWQYLLGQWLALVLAAISAGVLLVVVVVVRDPPAYWANWMQYWPIIVGYTLPWLAIAALMLLFGHLLRGAWVFVLAVLVQFFSMLLLTQVVPYTLLLSFDVRCSRILACPPLPYGWHALWVIAGVVLTLLAAERVLARHGLNHRPNLGALSGFLAVASLLAMAFAATTLIPAAQVYPQYQWLQLNNWPNIQPSAAQQLNTISYRQKLACIGQQPQVCLLPGQEALAERLAAALARLPKLNPAKPIWPDMIAFPSLMFAASTFGTTTIFVPESQAARARPHWVTRTSEASGKTRSERLLIAYDLLFLKDLLEYALLGHPVLESKRQADGSVRSTFKTSLENSVIGYLVRFALRADPAFDAKTLEIASTAEMAEMNSSKKPLPAKVLLNQQLFTLNDRLWWLGEKHGHDRLAKAIVEVYRSRKWQNNDASAFLAQLQGVLQ
jgi:hypothetical protein